MVLIVNATVAISRAIGRFNRGRLRENVVCHRTDGLGPVPFIRRLSLHIENIEISSGDHSVDDLFSTALGLLFVFPK